jgi:NAD(P)-dependent dehydrogenase (short-subunit alcohol dehydrogenase family)
MPTKPVTIVTGAAGGIGGALVAGFANAGYDVTAVDRIAGDNIVALDITDTAAVHSFAARFESVAVLINAAGILRHRDEYDVATFQNVVDVNLTGAMRTATAFEPALARAKGCVINIASMHAYFGAPHAPAYAASKAGVVQLTKSLAVAWGKSGVRVNAIAPGWIVTPMTERARGDETRNAGILARTPMARWGTPEDVIGPALFLASDAARFVTGAVLPVDGGYAAM